MAANATLSAGRLRHRISIEQRQEFQDTNGDTVVSWVPFLTNISAEIVPLSAREFIESGARQAEVTARIVIRYRPGIDAKMRCVHVAKGITTIYNIQGVLRDPGSGLRWLTLPVSEGVNDG